jgi:hypothetical protein
MEAINVTTIGANDFDVDFVDVENECPICFEHLGNNGVTTFCCNYRFCKSCYNNITECSLCRTDLRPFKNSIICQIINDKNLFTHIFQYLEISELKKICKHFKSKLHYDYIKPSENTLLFGSVQSGKTHKIVRFIKLYNPNVVKVLIIQNSLSMLSQMMTVLKNNDISYKSICKLNSKSPYTGEQVLIVIQNKFRIKAIQTYLKTNLHSIIQYCLIMDESDQYYNKIKHHKLIKDAKYILHVSATPYSYKKENNLFDNILTVKPQNNYIGIDNVDIKTIVLPAGSGIRSISNISKIQSVLEIVSSDFINKPHGLMLINCFRRVTDMETIAIALSKIYETTPIVLLSTTMTIWKKGKATVCKYITMQKLIDTFKKHSHIIFIANRYSNRGINYTDSNYARCITHQIAIENNNYTNFIQKCRIFGNRQQLDYCPVLYCLTRSDAFIHVNIKRYLNRVYNVVNKQTPALEPAPKKIKTTVKELRQICKDNNIKGYSTKKKDELVLMMRNVGIHV